jgi:hypothetical protein
LTKLIETEESNMSDQITQLTALLEKYHAHRLAHQKKRTAVLEKSILSVEPCIDEGAEQLRVSIRDVGQRLYDCGGRKAMLDSWEHIANLKNGARIVGPLSGTWEGIGGWYK